MTGKDVPQTIGVLIASYHRAPELARCLRGLAEQTRAPDDVIVVLREDDEETRQAVLRFPANVLKLRMVTVSQPGLIHARIAGCQACRTDVLAMTDDDAVPYPDWLERILRHFQADPSVGGVGGRDRCHDGEAFDDRKAEPVGKLQWFGRVIGNHHLGYGAAREVDTLKGANMSYRAKVFSRVKFDGRLRGSGSQPSEDLSFSTAVRHAGWKLIYDPAVLVDHYLGRRDEVRHYGGVMALKDEEGFRNFAFNEVMALWDKLPPARRLAFFLWSILVGTGVCPGLVQAIRFTPRLGRMSWHRFFVAQQGKLLAFRQLVAQASHNPERYSAQA